jgi:hypothetical protein
LGSHHGRPRHVGHVPRKQLPAKPSSRTGTVAPPIAPVVGCGRETRGRLHRRRPTASLASGQRSLRLGTGRRGQGRQRARWCRRLGELCDLPITVVAQQRAPGRRSIRDPRHTRLGTEGLGAPETSSARLANTLRWTRHGHAVNTRGKDGQSRHYRLWWCRAVRPLQPVSEGQRPDGVSPRRQPVDLFALTRGCPHAEDGDHAGRRALAAVRLDW